MEADLKNQLKTQSMIIEMKDVEIEDLKSRLRQYEGIILLIFIWIVIIVMYL